MDFLDYDENDLSDISMDFSMEANDSGIDACDARRSLGNYDLESESSSIDSESYGEDDLLVNHPPLRIKQAVDDSLKLNLKRIAKLYEPISLAQLQGIEKRDYTDDEDESILEVELTASGEDDEDSSVLELVIPMQNKFPKRSRIGIFQLIRKIFCCCKSLKNCEFKPNEMEPHCN